MSGVTLLADVGGTYTRLALAIDGVRGPVTIVESGAHASFADAARTLPGGVAQPDRAVIAAAGPREHGVITLTNGPQWRIDPDEIAAALHLKAVTVVNDFAALAAGAPRLGPQDLAEIKQGQAEPGGAIAVVGPGTGLGVALLAPLQGGRYRVLPSEGGHAALAPTNAREIAVLERLIQRFGHVKAEYVLSGLGLEILWETLVALDGADLSPLNPGEIAGRAASGACPLAAETIAIFTGWLGGFAGDIALIAGASGGVFIAGGILPRWGALFDTALFNARFLAKGTHRPLMEAMPVRLITDPTASFQGLMVLAEELP